MATGLTEIASRIEKLDYDDLFEILTIRNRQDLKLTLPANLKARSVLAQSGNREWHQAALDCENAMLRGVRRNAPGKFDGFQLTSLVNAAEMAALGICARVMLTAAEYDTLVEPIAKVCALELLDVTGEGVSVEAMKSVNEGQPVPKAVTPADPDESMEDRKKREAREKLASIFDDDEVTPAQAGAAAVDALGDDLEQLASEDGVVEDTPEPAIEDYPEAERPQLLVDAAAASMDAAEHMTGEAKQQMEAQAEELVAEAVALCDDYAEKGGCGEKCGCDKDVEQSATSKAIERRILGLDDQPKPEPKPAPKPVAKPAASGAASAFMSAFKKGAA